MALSALPSILECLFRLPLMPKATQPSLRREHFEAGSSACDPASTGCDPSTVRCRKVWRLRARSKSKANQWLRVPHLAVSHRRWRHFCWSTSGCRGSAGRRRKRRRFRWSSTGKSARLPSREIGAFSTKIAGFIVGMRAEPLTRADIAKWITERRVRGARASREQIAEADERDERSGNCRLFCSGVRGISRPKVGMPCRPRGAVASVWHFLLSNSGRSRRRIDKMLEDATVLRRKSATRTTRKERLTLDYRLAL